MKKFIRKAQLLFVSVVAGVIINFNGFNPPAFAGSPLGYVQNCAGVTDEDVIKYLEGFGYSNIVVISVNENGDRTCKSDCDCITIVYVEGDQIIGHEDTDQ